MRRTLIIYSLTLAVLCGMALIALGSLSEAFVDYWQWIDHHELRSWITNIPMVARVVILIPGLLFAASLFAIKTASISDLHLLHGIAFTAISLALFTIVSILAGFLPSIITIMRLPLPVVFR